jgi:hypothetical protein
LRLLCKSDKNIQDQVVKKNLKAIELIYKLSIAKLTLKEVGLLSEELIEQLLDKEFTFCEKLTHFVDSMVNETKRKKKILEEKKKAEVMRQMGLKIGKFGGKGCRINEIMINF